LKPRYNDRRRIKMPFGKGKKTVEPVVAEETKVTTEENGEQPAKKKKSALKIVGIVVGSFVGLIVLIIVIGLITGSDEDYEPVIETPPEVEVVVEVPPEDPQDRQVTGEMNRTSIRLHQIGMFVGTGDGYELERTPTRVEGLQVMIHLSGKADEALDGDWRHPFEDVPRWAEKYVGYAWQTGLTTGMGATIFGAERQMTFRMFCTLLMRVLGYIEGEGGYTYATAVEDALRFNLVTEEMIRLADCENGGTFLRGDMVLMANRLLHQSPEGEDRTVLQILVDRGLVDYDIAVRSDFEVEPPPRQIPVTLVTITNPPIEPMEIGETRQLRVVIEPSDATNAIVTWISSNPRIASVTQQGLLTAYVDGRVEITALVDKREFRISIHILAEDEVIEHSSFFDSFFGGELFDELEDYELDMELFGIIMTAFLDGTLAQGIADTLDSIPGAPVGIGELFKNMFTDMLTGEIDEYEAEEILAPYIDWFESPAVEEVMWVFMEQFITNLLLG
jgi:hypothetical protein